MEEIKPLEEMTVKELQEEATKKGVANADIFTTKAQLIAAIGMVAQPIIPTITTLDSHNPQEEKKSEKKWMEKRERMRKTLEAQRTVRILVPLEGKERMGVVEWRYNDKTKRKEQVAISGSIQPVTLNGYMYLIPKGTYVEVPEQIAQVIQDKFNQTSQAGAELKIDRIDPETGRPVADQL